MSNPSYLIPEQNPKCHQKFIWIIFGLSIIIVGLLMLLCFFGKPTKKIWSPKLQRELAVKLLDQEFTEEALYSFEKYLEIADIKLEEHVRVLFSMASTLIKKHAYNQAIALLYRIEILDPKFVIAPDTKKLIINCLTQLNRLSEAQVKRYQYTALYSSNALDFTTNILATFSDQQFTLGEFLYEIDHDPQFSESKLSRKELLNSLIFQKLLVQKAEDLNLDQHNDFVIQLAKMRELLLIQKYLESFNTNDINSEDLRLYYEANKELYATPEKANVTLIQASDSEQLAVLMSEITDAAALSIQKQKVPENFRMVSINSDYVPWLATNCPGLFSKIKETKNGMLAETLVVSNKHTAFYINELIEKTYLPFEQVAPQVHRNYLEFKHQNVISNMAGKLFSEYNVKINDKLLE